MFEYREYIIYYLVGAITFIVSIIDDIKAKKFTGVEWLQYSLFTLIAITAGVFACKAFDASIFVTILVSLGCGFLGGSLLTKIDLRKNEISDQVVDSLKDKMKNWSGASIAAQINAGNVNDLSTELEFDEHIKSHILIDDSNTIVDENQSDYNPFDEMCK